MYNYAKYLQERAMLLTQKHPDMDVFIENNRILVVFESPIDMGDHYIYEDVVEDITFDALGLKEFTVVSSRFTPCDIELPF